MALNVSGITEHPVLLIRPRFLAGELGGAGLWKML